MCLDKYDLAFIEGDLRHGIHELVSCPDCRHRRVIADKIAAELTARRKKEQDVQNGGD